VNPLTTRKLLATIVVGLTSIGASANPPYPPYTDWGSVTQLEGGWGVNSATAYHSAPLFNPDGCGITNAGYATSPDDAGSNLFHTLLLTSFLNRKQAALVISGCVFGKPRIVGVRLR
jgi:hypothetical protein